MSRGSQRNGGSAAAHEKLITSGNGGFGLRDLPIEAVCRSQHGKGYLVIWISVRYVLKALSRLREVI